MAEKQQIILGATFLSHLVCLSLYPLWMDEQEEMKKALRGTQTLRAGCSKAKPKKFARRRPHSRRRGTAKI